MFPQAVILFCCLACQVLKWPPLLGSFRYSVHQALNGPPSLGSFSVVQLLVLAFGERDATVNVPPPAHDSAVMPCLQGCLVFLQKHFPPRSPPSHPLGPSPYSQQQSSHQDFSPIFTLQLPTAAHSSGLSSLSGVHRSDSCSVMPDSLQPHGL